MNPYASTSTSKPIKHLSHLLDDFPSTSSAGTTTTIADYPPPPRHHQQRQPSIPASIQSIATTASSTTPAPAPAPALAPVPAKRVRQSLSSSLLAANAQYSNNNPVPTPSSSSAACILAADNAQIARLAAIDAGETTTTVQPIEIDEDAEDVFNSHYFNPTASITPNPTTAPLHSTPSVASSSAPISLSFPSPPLDWNLHARFRITSPHPFQWCESLTSKDEQTALQNLDAWNGNTNRLNTPQLKLMNSLFYYHFPSSSSSSSRSSSSSSSSLRERWSEYEQAFRSLYYQLRNGECQYFYYLTPHYTVLFLAEVEENEREKYWRESKENEDDLLHASLHGSNRSITAIVSSTTLAFRQQLSKHSIPYTQPHSRLHSSFSSSTDSSTSPPLSSHHSIDVLNEIQRLESLRPGSVRYVNTMNPKAEDRSISSMVIVRGRNSVHGLYDWLMNSAAERRALQQQIQQAQTSVQQQEGGGGAINPGTIAGVGGGGIQQLDVVPHLYSNTSFQYATMSKLQLLKINQLVRVKQASSTPSTTTPLPSNPLFPPSRTRTGGLLRKPPSSSSSSSSLTSLHYSLELVGPILPLNALKLFHLFTGSQEGEFSVRMWPMEGCGMGHFMGVRSKWERERIGGEKRKREDEGGSGGGSGSSRGRGEKEVGLLREEGVLGLEQRFRQLKFSLLANHSTVVNLFGSSVKSLNLSSASSLRVCPVLKRVVCKDGRFDCEIGQLIEMQ